MFEKDISKINIIYDIRGENSVQIFGPRFVANNLDKCEIVIDNKVYKITEKYNNKNNERK